MRLLYVLSYYKPAYVYGGPVNSYATECEALVELGCEVTVYTTNANGSKRLDVPLSQPVSVNGVMVHYFPLALRGLSFFYSPAQAAAIAAQTAQFDLAMVGCLWGHALRPTAMACRRTGIPYVIATHGQLFPWALQHKRLKKQLYLDLYGSRYVNGASALNCSDPTEAVAVSNMGFRPPIIISPHSVNVAEFTRLPARGGLRQRLGIDDETVALLFLGRLHHVKRPDIAVQVLAAVQSLPGRVELVLAGPDEEKIAAGLCAEARALGCLDRLHIVGLLRRDEVLQALADADLLIMPSAVNENFGMSAAEAMAAGVPILVSEGVPVGRLAEEVGAGRRVPCSVEAFVQAARDLLSTPEHLREMGRRGRTLVFERLDTLAVTRQELTQLQSIIETGRPLSEWPTAHA